MSGFWRTALHSIGPRMFFIDCRRTVSIPTVFFSYSAVDFRVLIYNTWVHGLPITAYIFTPMRTKHSCRLPALCVRMESCTELYIDILGGLDLDGSTDKNLPYFVMENLATLARSCSTLRAWFLDMKSTRWLTFRGMYYHIRALTRLSIASLAQQWFFRKNLRQEVGQTMHAGRRTNLPDLICIVVVLRWLSVYLYTVLEVWLF